MEVKDFYQYVMILIIKTLTILFLVQNSLKMSLKIIFFVFIRSGQKSIDLDLALLWQIILDL